MISVNEWDVKPNRQGIYLSGISKHISHEKFNHKGQIKIFSYKVKKEYQRDVK